MPAFSDLWNELTAQVRGLDGLFAQKLCNRAWSDIAGRYEWSWLRAQGVLSAPAAISTGTVSINQFSRTLTFNGAATAVLDAVGLDIPLSSRSIKIAGGPPYQLASYTAGGTATLDPLGPGYQEANAVAASYVIVRAFYGPPAADFARFISIKDPVSAYYLGFGANLDQQVLDALDPMRSSSTQPRGLFTAYTKRTQAAAGETTDYSPRWEMWPYPMVSRGYQVTYRRNVTEFVNDDDVLPNVIDPDVVMARAKMLAYEWAEANKANQPLLQGPNWLTLMVSANSQYEGALKLAIKLDRETFPNIVVRSRRGMGYSPDWLQSHDAPYELLDAYSGNY